MTLKALLSHIGSEAHKESFACDHARDILHDLLRVVECNRSARLGWYRHHTELHNSTYHVPNHSHGKGTK